MIKNGLGGANTRTGLVFEGKTDLATFLNSQQNYNVNENSEVFYNGEIVGQIFKKHAFYKFLESRGIKWQDFISKKLLPDDSIYVIINNTFFIIECRFDDEIKDNELLLYDFKKKQYTRLLSMLNMKVVYLYLLNDTYRNAEFNDALNYIHSMNCEYYFNFIPSTTFNKYTNSFVFNEPFKCYFADLL